MYNENVMNWMIYQLECCPTTGRLHWQGAFELRKGRTLKSTKNVITRGAHLEPMWGTPEENLKYCSKHETAIADTFKEFGGPSDAGSSEREGILDLALECKTIDDVAARVPKAYIMYGRLEKYFARKAPKRSKMPEVIILWGPSGTGKSHRANEICPDGYWLSNPTSRTNTVWWEGFNGERTVVIDEFDPQLWNASYLLRLLDKYPLRLDIKHGSATADFDRIVITSHFDPETWFPGRTPELMRRVFESRGRIEHLTVRFHPGLDTPEEKKEQVDDIETDLALLGW